jgi:hypothetical protein
MQAQCFILLGTELTIGPDDLLQVIASALGPDKRLGVKIAACWDWARINSRTGALSHAGY